MTLKYETWLYWLLLLDDFINGDIFLGFDGLKLMLLMYSSLPPIGLCPVQAQVSITATTLCYGAPCWHVGYLTLFG
jgi:hypothetical protein